MASSLNKILTRHYSNFRGVDFTNGIVSKYRSPDALNMWRDYLDDDCIQTRPGMELIGEFDYEVFGLFFYRKNNTTHVLVHAGTKLYKWDNFPNKPVEKTLLHNSMNLRKSNYFVFKDVLFIMDGINYLEYNGTTLSEVQGTIPTTSYWKNPDGSVNLDAETDKNYVYQDVNCLTGIRKNTFISDGTATDYHLDIDGLDADYDEIVTVDGTTKTVTTDYTVDKTKGIITFVTAPAKGAKVIIQFSRTASGYRERILNCTMVAQFDNRIFYSGNPDYPNAVFHCELADPRYIRDTSYYEMGIDIAPVKAIIPGNDVLWVVKETYQNQASVFYMTPTIDMSYGDDHKIYPSNTGNVSVGCVSTGINFNDDIVYFSKMGLEGISTTALYSEQVLQHRSKMVDPKLVNEDNYEKVILAEWQGYLLCLIDSHIYLADKRQKFTEDTDVGYEWYYWELPVKEVTSGSYKEYYPFNNMFEYRGDLFLSNAYGEIYVLEGETDNGEDITSYWVTRKDDFDSPSYTKTTNKKGCVINLKKMDNDEIEVTSIVDDVERKTKEAVDTYGYCVYKVKNKKFRNLQFKISSDKPFGLFDITVQGFIAGYIKR